MDFFYTAVIGIAILILIIILIVVGVMIYQSTNTTVYPPSSLECPNYWISGIDGNNNGICYIPTNGVNIGSFNGKNVAGIGSNVDGNYINFNDPNWGQTAESATCSKFSWANKNKILWDGISNFNGCST